MTPRCCPAASTAPFGFDSTAAEVVTGVDLAAKRAIVTGGSSGIGIDTARALAGGDQVGTQPAMKAGLAAWLLVSQAQMLAEAGVPPRDATG
jgi:hypothetical protein